MIRPDEDWRARAEAAEQQLAELTALVKRVRDGRSEGAIADLLVWLDRQEGGQATAPAALEPRSSISPHYAWREREAGPAGELSAEDVVVAVTRLHRDPARAVSIVEQYARQQVERAVLERAARDSETRLALNDDYQKALAERDAELERLRSATPAPAEPAAPVLSDEEREALELARDHEDAMSMKWQATHDALRVLCRLALAKVKP